MDKKALIQAYKETPRPMGVYCVRNTVNGRSLVGSSRDLPSILNRERTTLRFGVHRNVPLQNDWNQLGADAFVFEVLDTLTPPDDAPNYDPREDLVVLETLWIERLSPYVEGGYMKRARERN